MNGYQPAYLENLRAKLSEAATVIKGITNITPAISGKIQTFSTYDDEGWDNSLVTGKSGKITVDAYRVFGDPGNDAIAAMAFLTGEDCNMEFEYEFADGRVLSFSAAVDVTSFSGGAPTDLIPMKFDLYIQGKPTISEPTA